MNSDLKNLTGLRNERKPCHFWVDNEVADCYQPIVGADAIWVYCRIARNAHGAWIVSPKVRGGDTRVSLREMAEWCGKSVDTVWRCLQVLQHVGLLQAVRGAKAKGRYALADVKDLVTREGGEYDREIGSFRLPAARAAELKEQVRALRLKLARKKASDAMEATLAQGKDEISSVAQSDRLEGELFAVPEAKSDRFVALSDKTVALDAQPSITTKSKTARQNLPPQPPQVTPTGKGRPSGTPTAGEAGLTEEQLAHLATITGDEEEQKKHGLTKREWEGYYREQNRQAAEAAWEECAKAKRQQALESLLPDEPRALTWVMQECGFSGDERGRGVRGAIAAVLAQEHARGRPLWDVAPAMALAWRDYDQIGDLLAVQYGAVKFFRLGVWARRNSWRIDEKKAERNRASTGSGGRQ